MNTTLLKYLFGAFILGLAFVACTDDLDDGDDGLSEKDGPAVIDYVRKTDPTTSDSLITAAFLGNIIAIIGDNLGDTRHIWFNDQEASLNPVYITDKSVIVTIPTAVPVEVTNEMRLIFSDGSELVYPFEVRVSPPMVTGVKSEYVPDGGTLVFYGDFFFEPMTVTFPGGEVGTIESLTKNEVRVVVPEGAQKGTLSISTNFGSTESPFIFRDDRNVDLDYDQKIHETWTAPISTESLHGVEPISGGYAYFESASHGAWQWVNEMTMQYWAPRGRGNIPVATGLIDDLVFKMEVNVPVPWVDVRMEIFFGPYAEDHGRDAPSTAIARWEPFRSGPYTTDGWETLEIPLTEFKYNKDDGDDPTAELKDLSTLTNITIMMFGPAESSNPMFIAFDNVRIVPKS